MPLASYAPLSADIVQQCVLAGDFLLLAVDISVTPGAVMQPVADLVLVPCLVLLHPPGISKKRSAREVNDERARVKVSTSERPVPRSCRRFFLQLMAKHPAVYTRGSTPRDNG